jgi:hypothetical protein
MVIVVPDNQVLVGVMPEQRVGLKLADFTLGCLVPGTICIDLEPLKVVEDNGNDRAGLGILDLKNRVIEAEL